MKTENPKPANVEDIHKYALGLSKEIENAHSRAWPPLLLDGDNTPDIGEWLNEQLCLEIWTKKKIDGTGNYDDGAWKAEILLTCGGPTIFLEIDSRYLYATLHHSWGWTEAHGETKEWNMPEKATEILKDYIEECCLDC